MRGTDITVGSLVAIPIMSGRSAFTCVGKVVELVPPKEHIQERIRVEWLYGSTRGTPKSSLIIYGEWVVVLPDDFSKSGDDNV